MKPNESADFGDTVAATWETLHQRVPTVAAELEALQRVRETQLAANAGGVRLLGIEQLLGGAYPVRSIRTC